MIVKDGVNGHTYCGPILRCQHFGPLLQTDYAASLPLSSWKPNHQCASTDPATILLLREDQIPKAIQMPADKYFSLTMMDCMKVSGLKQPVPGLQTTKTQRIKWIAFADYKLHLLH